MIYGIFRTRTHPSASSTHRLIPTASPTYNSPLLTSKTISKITYIHRLISLDSNTLSNPRLSRNKATLFSAKETLEGWRVFREIRLESQPRIAKSG